MDNTAESVQKTKWLCMKTFFFWCKEEGIEDTGQILDFFFLLVSLVAAILKSVFVGLLM